MNIAITFRHLEASDSVKAYASDKVAKLQKFLRQPMRAKVTLSVENKQQRCEAELSAGPSHFVASETSDDMYASIDRVIDKLERQINHEHGASIARKRGAESAGAFAASHGEGDLPADDSGSLPPPPDTVKLTDIVTPDRVGVLPPEASLDKRQTLARIAELLARGLPVPPERILATLEERESLQSTGIGDGVAMPHGTLEGAQGQVGALLLCPGGVDFEAIDEKPSRILFGLIGPRNALEHLKILARMSRVLRNGGFRDRLLGEKDAGSAYRLLRSEDENIG